MSCMLSLICMYVCMYVSWNLSVCDMHWKCEHVETTATCGVLMHTNMTCLDNDCTINARVHTYLTRHFQIHTSHATFKFTHSNSHLTRHFQIHTFKFTPHTPLSNSQTPCACMYVCVCICVFIAISDSQTSVTDLTFGQRLYK